MIFVDGVDIGDPDDVALRDRRALSADGVFIVVATVSADDGRRWRRPEIIFRGVPFVEEADALVEELRDVVRGSLTEAARHEERETVAPPAGPARRHRGLRLRAPAPPADGAAGDRRGMR